MEEKITTEAVMPYKKMKEYLSEWYYEPQFSVSVKPAEYDSSKIFHVVTENYSGEVVFVWQTEMAEMFNDETMVSSTGIVGDELRGLIEQCFDLDKQLEADLNKDENQNLTISQKGE